MSADDVEWPGDMSEEERAAYTDAAGRLEDALRERFGAVMPSTDELRQFLKQLCEPYPSIIVEQKPGSERVDLYLPLKL